MSFFDIETFGLIFVSTAKLQGHDKSRRNVLQIVALSRNFVLEDRTKCFSFEIRI